LVLPFLSLTEISQISQKAAKFYSFSVQLAVQLVTMLAIVQAKKVFKFKDSFFRREIKLQLAG